MELYNNGIEELKKFYSFKIFDNKYKIHLKQDSKSFAKFIFKTKELFISYKELNDVFRLISETENSSLSEDLYIELDRKFEKFSLMIDLARDNVLKVETIKKVIRYMSLFGYNCLKLYLEDVFEVKNEPYFGYLRGRYKPTELKEIVDYASVFGSSYSPIIALIMFFLLLLVYLLLKKLILVLMKHIIWEEDSILTITDIKIAHNY